MPNPIINIKFHQKAGASPSFELLRLEEVYQRKGLDHNPEDLHRVEFFILLFIESGKGLHVIDFEQFDLQAGALLTIRKDQIHRFVRGEAEGYMLLFTEEFVVSYFDQAEVLKTLQIFNELMGSPLVQLQKSEIIEVRHLVEEMNKEFFSHRDQYSSPIIRSLLHILFNKIYRFKANKNQILEDKKYLEAFIQFQNLVEQACFQTKRVKDYAIKMGVSTKTLNNIVQSVLHKSAKTFIDEIVIKQIKRLLVNSDLQIKEIAYQAGFEEPSNLFKYFKKYTQVSPEQFRQKYKL
ncbi:MAG: AraC family transcriptional regulator [Saprospiraceae bacterium]|nr:AraC family transcriptional regulator [Saprospiraceae bacterium]